jgi:HEAT repeat protein
MKTMFRSFLVGLAALGFAGITSSSRADDTSRRLGGRSHVYKDLSAESLEDVSTQDAIKAVTTPGIAPTRIWSVLEHGEKVECLSCIPGVSKLLFDAHPKTREIAAWWLRRRVFGVFGEGQAYSQVVETLSDSSASEDNRVFAANALGEFLSAAGVKHVAKAVREDESAAVRAASVKALERLNSQGPDGELAFAMSDASEDVRYAAVRSAIRVNVFTGVESVLALIGDESPKVRRGAVDALGTMAGSVGLEDAVGGLMALTVPGVESDAGVRQRAVWALGQIASSDSRDALNEALSDPDRFVRDAAKVALLRL